MEFLQENKNIVMLIAIIVIGYFFSQSEMFKSLYINLRVQWANSSTFSKLVFGLIVAAIAYYFWTRQ